jgi:CubicO group peptidase (beta-lactamase class C family)
VGGMARLKLAPTTFALAMLAAAGCASAPRDGHPREWSANVAAFERELQDLQSALAIPGIAYVVVADGVPIATRGFGSIQGGSEPFTPDTPLRLASVTKALTTVVIMQLVEEGHLDLEAPVRRYVPALNLPDDVLVRHLLTHTSEGVVGAEYVYGTNRFSYLAAVVEAVAGRSFADALGERVIGRAGMRPYPSPDLAAHAGLVATTREMGSYLAALDQGKLLAAATLERLLVPSQSTRGIDLPVSLGWFARTVQGVPLAWSFGQDDPDHSGALLVHVPSRRVSLFVLANSNVLSDPFRLLMGDVRKSPFVMSFVRLFVASPPGAPLPRPSSDAVGRATELAVLEQGSSYSFRDELHGWALIDLWNERAEEAHRKLELATSRYGAGQPDPVLHFAALRLPEGAKDAAIASGEELLAKHPDNRWMLLAQGYLLQQRGRGEAAAACFRHILALPNQEPDFLARLFQAWSWTALAELVAADDSAAAREYLRRVIASGVGGELAEQAALRLEELAAAGAGG